MKKRRTTEATVILKNSPVTRLMALNKINKNEDMKAELFALLTDILRLSETAITRSAAAVNSMDTMIDTTINQAFYRGRISSAVLVRALIENSSSELEKREDKKRK